MGYHTGNRKLACVAQGTAKTLSTYVDKIDFVGTHVDIKKTAKEFVHKIGKNSCLFPVSDISKRTIQKAFSNASQVVDVVVYHTSARLSRPILPANILVFTSPSNVRNYFEINKIKERQTFVVQGPSTGEELKKHGIIRYYIPAETGEIGLIDLILRLY